LVQLQVEAGLVELVTEETPGLATYVQSVLLAEMDSEKERLLLPYLVWAGTPGYGRVGSLLVLEHLYVVPGGDVLIGDVATLQLRRDLILCSGGVRRGRGRRR